MVQAYACDPLRSTAIYTRLDESRLNDHYISSRDFGAAMSFDEELLDGARAPTWPREENPTSSRSKKPPRWWIAPCPHSRSGSRRASFVGVREDEENPRSRMLVSRKALMLLMATAGKATNPPRPKASTSSGPSKAVLQAELAGQQALVAALQTQLEMMGSQISAIEEAKRSEQRRADDWKERARVSLRNSRRLVCRRVCRGGASS